jgi:hypothetical protein
MEYGANTWYAQIVSICGMCSYFYLTSLADAEPQTRHRLAPDKP